MSDTTPTGSRRVAVRHVNGEGPRCGCGKASKLHVIHDDLDYFLCSGCTLSAVEEWLISRDQALAGPCVRTDEWWHGDDCKYCVPQPDHSRRGA